jgi:hypothetical protein
MEEVRIKLEQIRAEFSASASPRVVVAGDRQNVDIPVHFSNEQFAVMSNVLAMDSTGSSNLTSSMRSLVVSRSSDHVERKHQPLADDGFGADAGSGRK